MSNNCIQQQTPRFDVFPRRKNPSDPLADMYMRICYSVYRAEKSLGIKIEVEKWNRITEEVTGMPQQDYQIKQKKQEYSQKIMGAFYMLTQHGGDFTLREILDTAFPTGKTTMYSVFSTFNSVILKLEKELKPGKTPSNAVKHKTCLKHLKNYVLYNHKSTDINFARINRSFIDGFESYLKTEVKHSHNSAMKMLQIFKKIYRIGVDNRWIAHNAFAGRKLSFENVEMEYLTAEEINVIAAKEIKNARLQVVRDLFLFACFTGLSYVDLKALQRRHIEYNPMRDRYLIKKKREKTGQPFIIPLLHEAQAILDERVEGWEKLPPLTFMLPVMSNQKYNQYLKELAALCNIEKNLTSHMARHSFATSISLEKGISLETTSKMLGHSKISQTQRYAKITELKIIQETDKLFNNT